MSRLSHWRSTIRQIRARIRKMEEAQLTLARRSVELVVQNHVQRRTVNLYLSVVVYEFQFSESVHEELNPASRDSHQFGQHLSRNRSDRGLRLTFLSMFREAQRCRANRCYGTFTVRARPRLLRRRPCLKATSIRRSASTFQNTRSLARGCRWRRGQVFLESSGFLRQCAPPGPYPPGL